MALTLTADQRRELERRATSRTIRAEDAKRAKVILMLADGVPYSTIEASLWCYRDFINRWHRRFMAKGLDGLNSRHQRQRATVLTPALEARILAKPARRRPMAARIGAHASSPRRSAFTINHVQATWRRAGLKPHRFERYMLPDDPDFETKAADVLGLYLKPPQHAVVPSTKRRRFKRWTASTPCCRCRPAASNGTASSTTGMARSPCSPR